LSIAATSASKNEGDSGTTDFTFTVTRSVTTDTAVSVGYVVSGSAVNADDFVGSALPSGTVTFAAGETSKTITVPVAGDTAAETDEAFTVTLINASGDTTIAVATASGTIRNDDVETPATPVITIAANDSSRNESDAGETPYLFTVTRSGNTTGSTTVDYVVTGTGANPASADDFGGSFPSGVVSFAAGETSQVVTVSFSGDNVVEADERFRVTLQNPSGDATIATTFAEGLIIDNDRNVVSTRMISPSLIAGLQVVEGDNVPTAMIFRATMETVVTVLPIGSASATEDIRVLDGDTNTISEFVAGVTSATVRPGSLYAIVFGAQTSRRIFSIRSSAGFEALSSAVGTNIIRPTDTNADGETTARDALVVINELGRDNAEGERISSAGSTNMMDVNADGSVSALDALMVINALAKSRLSESEQLVFSEPDSDSSVPTSLAPVSVTIWDEAKDSVDFSSFDWAGHAATDQPSDAASMLDVALEEEVDWRAATLDDRVSLLSFDAS
ncbi:MAG: Calx-beta domain-containing protein, partial [Rubripirellula sp.]